MNCSFIEHFSSLKDPRIERKKLHMLIDILVLTVCATLSGAEGWEEIEEFSRSKLDWLRRFVPLKNGVPSHDCIAYVISRLSPEGFRRCFMSWVEAMRAEMPSEVIAIDGKTARGSRDRKHNKKSFTHGERLGWCKPIVVGTRSDRGKVQRDNCHS